MAAVDEPRRATNRRQVMSNLRELLNKVDIKAGADPDRTRFAEEAEVSTLIESEAERSQSPQTSLRDVFAKARTGIPRATGARTPASSRLPRPRTVSAGSDISSAPTALYTPGRKDLSDDESTAEHTPIARGPPQPLGQTPSAAASFNALRARLERTSDTHTDTGSDTTGWDHPERSLMTTRGQASSSKLNVYLDDNDDTNLLDEDLGGVPALTVSHVDDSNMRFTPSVGNTSRTPLAHRSRPNPFPKGPSLQSASIAERLASIPDDGLGFDDTDREDLDRNRMGDDNQDLLNEDDDLIRSSSPPPDQLDSPRRPQAFRSLLDKPQRSSRPISGSWENVMGESLLSLPNPPESPERPAHASASKLMLSTNHSTSGSSSGDASRLMQTIQSEEESFQRTMQDNTRQSATDNSQADVSNGTRSDSTTPARTSRLSTFGRSRLPLAKPSPKPPTEASTSSAKPPTSEIRFPRSSTPTSPEKRDPAVTSTPQSPPRPRAVSAQPSPGSPPRSTSRPTAPVTPSRIPRVSMHGSQPSWDRIDDADKSPQPLTRSQSSLGQNSRLTPARSTSSLGHRSTPPETDVDRERNWNKRLPKLTHANLRMRHESMESSAGSSVYGGLSPSRPGSVVGGRPTTPSGRSFVGYSVREGSEVSSSQGSAGSDEDAEARRARKMSSPSIGRSGSELRGHRSSLTSPTASSLARSAGLTRHSSLKSPARGGAPSIRHSASFAGSSVSGLSDKASPVGSPARKLVTRKSADGNYDKEVEHLRERDWGRPVHSRAPGIASISPRPLRVSSGARQRVVSGGSLGDRSESPITRPRASSGAGLKPRPNSYHFGGTGEELGGPLLDRGPLGGGEELLEEHEQETEREDIEFSAQGRSYGVPASPPSPSRSIPLPPSPPAVRASDPTEASISLFKTAPEHQESSFEPAQREPEPAKKEPEPTREPESPRRRIPVQPESPTISFMDTLPPLPEPPSDDENEEPVLAPVPIARPQVNTRLSAHHLVAREPSPASGGSGSERTPRVSSLVLPVPPSAQSRTPSPPTQPPTIRVENDSRGLDLVGLEQSTPAPKVTRTRSRSNTLGAVPRVDVLNLNVPKDDIDSAATPVATKWMERNRIRALERERDTRGAPTSRDAITTPQSETPPVPPVVEPPQSTPVVSQRSRDIIQRLQHSTAALGRDLEVESLATAPEPKAAQPETEQIVKLSTTARTERERLERLRSARQTPAEKVAVASASNKRWSIPWILLSMLLTVLCAWLALYALSQHASNVYLDPLYPVLYGGDTNPLRPARTFDTFPSGWHAHKVSQHGLHQYLPLDALSQNWQKLWAVPNWTIQHLILNWPPS